MPLFVNNGKKPTDLDVADPNLPTPEDWGENTEVLVADKVLVDGDPIIQYLDPGAADRDVTLPVPAVSNPLFFIINTGLRVLAVKSGTQTIATVLPGKAIRTVSNGVLWVSMAADGLSIASVGQMYQFGGNIGANQFFPTNQPGFQGAGGNNPDDAGRFQVILEDGDIDAIFSVRSFATAFRNVSIFIDEVEHPEAAPLIAADGVYRFIAPIPVTQGQRIAVRDNDGDAEATHVVRVRNSVTPGYIMPFGGNITALGRFYMAMVPYHIGTGETVEGPYTTFKAIGNGNLTGFYHTSNGGVVTDRVEIFHNGGLAALVTLTNGTNTGGTGNAFQGIETLAIPFVEGDTFAIKSVDDLGSQVTFGLRTDVPGMAVTFGGNCGNQQFYRAYAEHANAGSQGQIQDNDSRIILPKGGNITLSWNSLNVPTTTLLIAKNNIVSEEVDWTSSTQGVVLLNTSFEEGDVIAASQEGVGQGRTNILMVIN